MIDQIAFGVVSAVMVFSALRVVTASNLVHTVLWLGVLLGLTAVTYVMLLAPFLAAIQLILYTGGVLTLMLFGVMLTQREAGTAIPNETARQPAGALIACLVAGVLGGAIVKTPAERFPDAAPAEIGTEALGVSFLTTHVLAFEVLSVLLLAAVLGAIVIARKSDPARETKQGPVIAPRRRPETAA